jgi:hypothetical protein
MDSATECAVGFHGNPTERSASGQRMLYLKLRDDPPTVQTLTCR